MQPGDEAIPEAKVAFRGLLRRKRLAMTKGILIIARQNSRSLRGTE